MKIQAARYTRWLRRATGILGLLLSIPIVLPWVLLLPLASTQVGRWWGGVSLSFWILILGGFLGAMGRSGPARWVLAVALVLLLILAFTRPTWRFPQEARSSGLLSQFDDASDWPRFGPIGEVSERELVTVGSQLISRFTPWMSGLEASRLRVVPDGMYGEIERHLNGPLLPSATGLAMAELAGQRLVTKHYYAYVPEPLPGERLGVIIFLHGNGGNFQLLPWVWRELAESERMAIVCPTFGFGFWGDGGVNAIDRVWQDARIRFPIDETRVYLGGISDGGQGVTREATAHPNRYVGLIYISPTMNPDELSHPNFVQGWKGRPVLVLTGGRDWNVRPMTVKRGVQILQKQGVDVSFRFYPEEDHFLLFARREAVRSDVEDWLEARNRSSSTSISTQDKD